MVQWEDYHVKVHRYKGLGLVITIEHGLENHKGFSRAGDRTEEVLSTVMEYFQKKFQRQEKEHPEKKYIGVASNYGKLLYVPKGFSIRQNQDGSIKITPPKPPERRMIDYYEK